MDISVGDLLVTFTRSEARTGLRIVVEVHALILWDVDHTLVENAGVSKETYAAAFGAVSGIAPRYPARTDGRTDRVIMRELFMAHDLPSPDWPTIYAALEAAGAERSEAMGRRGWVLPGVREAIAAFGRNRQVVQSVLTGNILPNARMKLAAFGLGDQLDFEVGAYGSDSDDRATLVSVAQSRAVAACRGELFDRSNTVLIGDTPRDVDAGLRGGAQVVAVSTGEHGAEELRAAGAALVFEDLTETEALVAAVSHLLAKAAAS
jgi:phosphoglycolate phosphatase